MIISSGRSKINSFFVLSLMATCCISCNQGLVFSEYVALENGIWKRQNTISFAFSELDSTARHDLFLNIRNDNNYEFSNLFLILQMETPDGIVTVDTLEYEMALPDGSWLGEGSGSVKENKLWYKENISFPKSGVYTLNIRHAMRRNGTVEGIDNLEGVTDVGLQIEKAN